MELIATRWKKATEEDTEVVQKKGEMEEDTQGGRCEEGFVRGSTCDEEASIAATKVDEVVRRAEAGEAEHLEGYVGRGGHEGGQAGAQPITQP